MFLKRGKRWERERGSGKEGLHHRIIVLSTLFLVSLKVETTKEGEEEKEEEEE